MAIESKESAPVTWEDVQAFMSDLKQTARWLLGQEGNAGSVHTTQLVNSALKKLLPTGRDWQDVTWRDREAFFKDAHFSMRRLLVDYARRRKRRQHVPVASFGTELISPLVQAGVFDLDRLVTDASDSEELAEAVTEALAELEQLYPKEQLSAIIEHRVFDGLGQEEIARILGVTERTVRTRQKLAYALMRKALRKYYEASPEN